MQICSRGFTLVELMIVVIVITVIAAVAIPKFTLAAHKAKASEFPPVLIQIYTAESAMEAEIGMFSSNWTSLGLLDPTAFSTYFTYAIPSCDPSTGYGRAAVKKVFGDATLADTAGISFVNGKKEASAALRAYATTWQ
jgi:prepilin-type N-terminal cleavage/methylation domain-containing protein